MESPQFDDWFWAGVALSALLLFVGHWFPWPVELHKLAAYVYGVGSILAGFALWQLQASASGWQSVVGLVAIATVSGFAVFLAYGIDWVVVAIRGYLKIEQADKELKPKEPDDNGPAL